MSPRAITGNPTAIVFRGRDLAIERRSGLQRHQRTPGAHEVKKRLVQGLALALKLRGDLYFDAGRTEPPEALTTDERVRVRCRGHDLRDAGADQGIRAGSRAARMRAGLQRQIDGRSARRVARLFERENLGVLHGVPGVKAAPHNLAAGHDQCADHGIGRGERDTFPCERERLAHVVSRGHWANSESMNASGSKGIRSSTFSPTPIKRIGSANSRAIATITPPFAVPSSLVRTMPVTPEVSVNFRACSSPFWPVVASSTSNTSCGASGITRDAVRRIFSSSAMRLAFVCRRPAVSTIR